MGIDRNCKPDSPQLVIEELERRQHRAVRDVLLIGDIGSRQRLQDIEDDIRWLRELIRKRV